MDGWMDGWRLGTGARTHALQALSLAGFPSLLGVQKLHQVQFCILGALALKDQAWWVCSTSSPLSTGALGGSHYQSPV